MVHACDHHCSGSLLYDRQQHCQYKALAGMLWLDQPSWLRRLLPRLMAWVKRMWSHNNHHLTESGLQLQQVCVPGTRVLFSMHVSAVSAASSGCSCTSRWLIDSFCRCCLSLDFSAMLSPWSSQVLYMSFKLRLACQLQSESTDLAVCHQLLQKETAKLQVEVRRREIHLPGGFAWPVYTVKGAQPRTCPLKSAARPVSASVVPAGTQLVLTMCISSASVAYITLLGVD